MISRSIGVARAALDTLGRGRFLQDRELLIERKLLRERLAEVVVIVHQAEWCVRSCGSVLACWSANSTPIFHHWQRSGDRSCCRIRCYMISIVVLKQLQEHVRNMEKSKGVETR